MLVSFIGPPGSGKTTVARRLARAMSAEVVCEDYAGNPFLAESYAGRDEHRLAGQAWFLLSRVNQLARARWDRRRAVSDYAFVQDRVYARIWLDGADWAAYEALAERVGPLVRPPDVLVHLDGPLDLLCERIARRGREYETYFTRAFVQRLRDEYAAVLADPPAPVATVDVGRRDMLEQDNQAWLVERVTGLTRAEQER